MSDMTIGGYVRHRDRMIQESVYQDLHDTLIACRWMAGTTSQPVGSPYAPTAAPAQVTTNPEDVLALLEGNPVVLIDYFPDAEGGREVGEPVVSKTALNTLAIDAGTRTDSQQRELGSNAEEIEYRFNLAFYASSDGVALALLNDLADRYKGRIVRGDTIDLWDYNAGGALPVTRMDVDDFRYTFNTDAVTAPAVHLYFGELRITDHVD